MTFRTDYEAACTAANSDAIESGLFGKLADNECRHGRLPTDSTKRCGCWREEGAVLKVIDTPPPERGRKTGLSEEASVHIINLRKGGMTMPDIVVALDYFLGMHVTYQQVRHLTYGKTIVRRGVRPAHATKEPKSA